MKQIFKKLKWLPFQIIGLVSFVGLALAAIGIIFEYPYLYMLGLKLSSLIFIIVLPVCILLVAILFPLGLCYAIIDAIKKKT
jgi:uncharacterized membrane protein